MILLGCLLSLLIRPSFGSPLASSGSSSACPEGWADGTLVGMGCLLFESNASYTWDNANYFCQDTHNATLVSIESEDQHEFVIMMIRVLNNHEDPHIWWTSGTDKGREGEWYWASTLTAVGRFIWSQSNQPDGLLAANCLSLGSSSGTGYDDTCTSSFHPICEKV